jgi:hypothetical protein
MSSDRKQPTTSLALGEKGTAAHTSVIPKKVPPPVRVRLRRITATREVAYPPDGQSREWWQRLKDAFGTASSAFVDASLQQLIASARLPFSGISESAVNASLAFIERAKPQDEVESALVMQMASTHAAAMAVLATLGGAAGGERNMVAKASAIWPRMLPRCRPCHGLHGRKAFHQGRSGSSSASRRAALPTSWPACLRKNSMKRGKRR